MLIATYSAKPPTGGNPITFEPIGSFTFVPLSSITPKTSFPGVKGGSKTTWYLPCTNNASGKLTPAASTLINTSSSVILGWSISFIEF